MYPFYCPNPFMSCPNECSILLCPMTKSFTCLSEVRQTLSCWLSNLDRFKLFRSLQYLFISYPTLLCFSDASASGGASFFTSSIYCAALCSHKNLIRKARYNPQMSDSPTECNTLPDHMIDVLSAVGTCNVIHPTRFGRRLHINLLYIGLTYKKFYISRVKGISHRSA